MHRVLSDPFLYALLTLAIGKTMVVVAAEKTLFKQITGNLAIVAAFVTGFLIGVGVFAFVALRDHVALSSADFVPMLLCGLLVGLSAGPLYGSAKPVWNLIVALLQNYKLKNAKLQ